MQSVAKHYLPLIPLSDELEAGQPVISSIVELNIGIECIICPSYKMSIMPQTTFTHAEKSRAKDLRPKSYMQFKLSHHLKIIIYLFFYTHIQQFAILMWTLHRHNGIQTDRQIDFITSI